MIALSDQSTMGLWPAWVWLLLAAAVLVATALLEQRHYRHRDEPTDYWPVDLDAPVDLWPVCDTTGCHYQARTAVGSFTGTRMVCRGCADEGIAHGWFTAA